MADGIDHTDANLVCIPRGNRTLLPPFKMDECGSQDQEHYGGERSLQD